MVPTDTDITEVLPRIKLRKLDCQSSPGLAQRQHIEGFMHYFNADAPPYEYYDYSAAEEAAFNDEDTLSDNDDTNPELGFYHDQDPSHHSDTSSLREPDYPNEDTPTNNDSVPDHGYLGVNISGPATMFFKGTGPDYSKHTGENTTDQTVHLSQGECQESKDSKLSLNPARVRKSTLTPQTI